MIMKLYESKTTDCGVFFSYCSNLTCQISGVTAKEHCLC